MTSHQLPYDLAAATQVGPKLWRKQVLKTGTINYHGTKLKFDRRYLADLAAQFNAGILDQVPFVLATDANAHNANPERFRGEVKAIEQSGDALFALLETTPDGTKLIADNPRLGVSCRLVPDPKPHIEHVLGTLNPVVTGMAPWEAVSLSTDSSEVVDLTAATINPEGPPMPITDEQRSAFDAYVTELAALAPTDPPPDDTTDDDTSTDTGTGDVSDADLAAALALVESGDLDTADLSQVDDATRSAIELTRAQAQSNAVELARVRDELDATRFGAEKAALVAVGVPPAIVELATPLLLGTDHTIDLSNGSTVDAGDVVRKILHELEGTIDLSGEHPGAPTASSSKTDALLAAWESTQPVNPS